MWDSIKSVVSSVYLGLLAGFIFAAAILSSMLIIRFFAWIFGVPHD
jgi:hypothetical protein